LVAPEQARGPDRGLAEPAGEAVESEGQALPARGIGTEQGELPLTRTPQLGHRQPDQPHGLFQLYSLEERPGLLTRVLADAFSSLRRPPRHPESSHL